MDIDIEKIRQWFVFTVSVVACVAGVIFWVQTSSDAKMQRIKEDISELRSDVKSIQEDNREIIRIIGKLEGLIDK